MFLAMMDGCSKPDDDSLLLLGNGDPIGAAKSDSFTVTGLDGDICVIGYVVLNGEEDSMPK